MPESIYGIEDLKKKNELAIFSFPTAGKTLQDFSFTDVSGILPNVKVFLN